MFRVIYIRRADEPIEYYEREEVDAELDKLRAIRDAWKELALHQFPCATCAGNVYDCDTALALMVAIRQLEPDTSKWLDSEELEERLAK